MHIFINNTFKKYFSEGSGKEDATLTGGEQ